MNATIHAIEQLRWSQLMLKIIHIDSMKFHSSKDVNDKDPKFKVDDHVRISKYKNIFAKEYTPNWPEEVFVIKELKKLKRQFRGHMSLIT